MSINSSKIGFGALNSTYSPPPVSGNQSDTVTEALSIVSSAVLGTIDFDDISEVISILSSSSEQYLFANSSSDTITALSQATAANLQIFSLLDSLDLNHSESILKNALKILSESIDITTDTTTTSASSITSFMDLLDTKTSTEIYGLVESLLSSDNTTTQGLFYLSLLASLSLSTEAVANYLFSETLTELFSYLDLPSKVQQEFVSISISTLANYIATETITNSEPIQLTSPLSIKATLKYLQTDNLVLSSIPTTNSYITVVNLLLVSMDLFAKEYSNIPEYISLKDQNNSKQYISAVIENIVSLNTLFKLITNQTLSENILLSEGILTLVVAIGELLEELNIDSESIPGANTFLTLLDTLLCIDKSLYAVLGSISETIEYNLISVSIRKAIANILEEVETVASYVAGSVLLVPISDSIDLDSSEYLQSVIHALLSDELLLVLPYKDNSANYFTYAFSPEKNTTSTYDNYNFDGCCVFKDKYLFFNKTGIYEYGSSFDNGTPIQSEITTSALMYATSNLKSVPSVYLGVVNSDTVILKVRTDGRGEFTYKLNKHTDNLHTQKIGIGKGVIGRYFQFDLITSAEEFELNSIEFLPLTLKRKI